MKNILFIITIFTSACNNQKEFCKHPDFITSGLEICYDEYVDKIETDIMVSLVEEEASIYYPEVIDIRKAFKNTKVKVWFVNDNLSESCRDIGDGVSRCANHIEGQASGGGVRLYVKWNRCLAETAFAHELLHSIEALYLGGATAKHTTKYFFQRQAGIQGIGVHETVEYRVNSIARAFDGCIPAPI